MNKMREYERGREDGLSKDCPCGHMIYVIEADGRVYRFSIADLGVPDGI